MDYPNRVIKEGETDAVIVKAIQQQLISHGIGDLKGTGIFADKTKNAVKLFQAMHRDKNGWPLETDGKVGSITWEALFGPGTVPAVTQSNVTILIEVLKVAVSQVGVMEVPPGSNKGPEVNAYLASTGLDPGYFWCAAFVYWCFNEASKNIGFTNPLYKTAVCLE
jgi:peptidoglycan hydrolase-like protein with peptidoglycan-binding domain